MTGNGSTRGFDDLVIHVGYHKAGSTLLQNRLFNEEHGVSSPWSQDFYHQHVLLDRPDSGWATRIRRAFLSGIDHARQRDLVPVLSCEALSGDMWRLGQSNGYGNFHVAEALAEAFPGARVVLVQREQRAMIVSLYKHSVRSHWRYGLGEFLDQSPLERGKAPVLNFGYLEYSWLVEHYVSLMGPDRVIALPFELLRDTPAWSDRWSEILGRPVEADWFAGKENPGMSALVSRGKRFANFAIPAGAEPNSTRRAHAVNSLAYQVDLRVPESIRARSEQRVREQVDSVVDDYFAPDNTRLSRLTGRDWASFGYPTVEARNSELVP